MNRIFLVLLVATFGVNAQNVSFSLDWKAPKVLTGSDFTFSVPNFSGASYKNAFSVVPEYCKMVETNSWQINNVVLSNISTASLSDAEQKLMKNHEVGAEFEVIYNVTGKESRPYASFCVTAIRKNETTGQYEKLLGANIIWNNTIEDAMNKTQTFTGTSVLAKGDWYKVSVAKDGIYKITPAFLQEIGLGSNISIQNIGVFGNGIGELPEANAAFRYDDLQENGIFVSDQNGDGIFNGSDFLLFYGRGSKRWVYNETTGFYGHRNQHYSDKNYYFITSNQGTSKGIGQVTYNPNTATHIITDFDDYKFIELDKINLLGTGRRWFGDLFDFKLSYNYNFTFPNINLNEPVKIYTVAIARSLSSNTTMSVNNAGNLISSFSFPAVSTGTGANFVSEKKERGQFTANGSNIPITVNYNNNINPSAIAWLDYIELVAKRNLVFGGNSLFFRNVKSLGTGNVAEYNISNMSANAQVWDVTDYINPAKVNFTLQGSNAKFKAPANTLREFVVVAGINFAPPEKVGRIANQNLHGLAAADMIIITHKDFANQAERLAKFHRDFDNMRVAVVEINDIYNEYSSGGQDITAIRDFMRNLKEKAIVPKDEPQYLLLFGDASYDYKGAIDPNHNFIPIFESKSSFSLYISYSTDDYYSFLDISEGVNLRTEIADLSIGRFVVKTPAEAKVAVDKAIYYVTDSNSYGSWRNNLLFITDDVDANWEMILTTSPEGQTRKIEKKYPAFNIQKIYSDAYVQKSSAGSQRYPEARSEMFRKVESGNLMTLYVGHGGEVGWATERILQLDDVNSWKNKENMPVFVTITCEFSRLDDPKRVSAGEQLFLNANGGAVSLISTTRTVFVGPALAVNNALLDTIFGRVDGKYQRMGDIVRSTKNQVFADERLKFCLLGDPALKMAIPEYKVVNTKINGKPVGNANDTIKALSLIKLSGEVRDQQGNKMTGFNGRVEPQIFDKSVNKQTLMNDGAGSVIKYKQYENVIYRGAASVTNGEFEFEFVVPLDISYNLDFGKLNYYVDDKLEDGHGSYKGVYVGGLNTGAAIDKIGPDIKLFINDPSFVSGGITDKNPVIYVEVFDSSGVNTLGNSIGHDITAVLDDNTNNTLVLNDFYDADLNSYQSGKIKYPMFDIKPGEHKLQLRVWDVYNNPSESVINFIVSESKDLALSHVLNWPNPFTTYTEFQFEHNRAAEPLDVQVQIFSVSGQIIKTINQRIQATGNRVTGIAWNGLDEYGDPIAKGVYVYKLKVKSSLDNSYAEKIEKLVILR